MIVGLTNARILFLCFKNRSASKTTKQLRHTYELCIRDFGTQAHCSHNIHPVLPHRMEFQPGVQETLNECDGT